MTTATTTRYLLTGAADIDVTGSEPVVVTDRHSTPCRRCLRDAEPGERVHLVSYDPFVTDSPYRSASPVFVHADPCAVYAGHAIPEQQRRRLLSVRAFDGEAMMRDAEVVDGIGLADALDRLFADSATAFVHVHNAGPGCFSVRVTRVGQPDG